MGSLANSRLRRARNGVHEVLDPLWRNGHVRRTDMYRLLSKRMGVPKDDCHIGMFDTGQCEQAKRILEGVSEIIGGQADAGNG